MVKTDEIEKGNGFVMTEAIEYVTHSIVSKVLLKKATGVVSIFSVDAGKTLPERTAPFDTLLQLIDGQAEVSVETKSIVLEAGQAIIIPAHARNHITARVRFKMISTIVKSGYEEVT